jgi:hypothetical protein
MFYCSFCSRELARTVDAYYGPNVLPRRHAAVSVILIASIWGEKRHTDHQCLTVFVMAAAGQRKLCPVPHMPQSFVYHFYVPHPNPNVSMPPSCSSEAAAAAGSITPWQRVPRTTRLAVKPLRMYGLMSRCPYLVLILQLCQSVRRHAARRKVATSSYSARHPLAAVTHNSSFCSSQPIETVRA